VEIGATTTAAAAAARRGKIEGIWADGCVYVMYGWDLREACWKGGRGASLTNFN
jgi:hypothetical protein